LGHFGVVVFFVLSGFLITRLLLLEPTHKPLLQSFKEFYIRRSLRIFPIYYLFLAVTYFFNVSNVNQYGAAPWFYATNLKIFATNNWIGSYSHLWTLAVEEQFYLVWPFLILFLRGRTKTLFYLFIGIITLSILMRFGLMSFGFSGRQATVFSLSSIDYFGLGSLIAIGQIHNYKFGKLGWQCLFLGIFIYYGLYFSAEKIVFNSVGHFGLGLVAFGLVVNDLNRSDKKTIFHNKITIHFGKISYGIYLYHNIIAARYVDILGFFGITVQDSNLMRTIFALLFTLTIAELSFYFVETPFLRLKERFASRHRPSSNIRHS
jgi:peptidoglycan/LPS O-acetylase OafA/YrhL